MNDKEQHKLCIKICHEAHKGQVRRGGTPYVFHPIRIAETFKDPIVKCIAFLHDVCEDSDITLSDLSLRGVDPLIVKIVGLLTRTHSRTYREYIIDISKNHIATLVKIADIVDNLTDQPTEAQIKKYRKALFMLTTWE